MTDGSVCLVEHIIVACPPLEAVECLNGPVAIAGWFGCRRVGSQTTIASAEGDLVLELAHEEWLPDDGALLVIGTTGSTRSESTKPGQAFAAITEVRPTQQPLGVSASETDGPIVTLPCRAEPLALRRLHP